jgi:hypothetical protein
MSAVHHSQRFAGEALMVMNRPSTEYVGAYSSAAASRSPGYDTLGTVP